MFHFSAFKNIFKPRLTMNGYCLFCESDTVFSSNNSWLRDSLRCRICKSIPRERALMAALNEFYPSWCSLKILEISASKRGGRRRVLKKIDGYVATQYRPKYQLGTRLRSGLRNENIENLTFPNEYFDIVITQDVFEHVLHPDRGFCEIARVLKKGGSHIFTVPLVKKMESSEICAIANDNGILLMRDPIYHGDDSGSKAALVTRLWGYDICEYIHEVSDLSTIVHEKNNRHHGILGEYTEVLISTKSQ